MGSALRRHLRDRKVRRRLNGVVREGMVTAYGSDGVRGILYGDASQLVMQAIDCSVLTVFAFVMAYVWFKIFRQDHAIRVSKEPS